MAALYPSPLLSAASSHLHSSTKMAFMPHPSPPFRGLETGLAWCNQGHALGQSFMAYGPVLLGMAIAQVLKLAAVDASPRLKDAQVPWHLILMAIFFTLLKLPGPYYPFWGRILIPHFANGGLLRTLWFAFLWYRRPRKAFRTAPSQHSESDGQSEL